LLESEYRVINSFLDGLLKESKPSNDVLKGCGEKLNQQWNERKVQTNIEGPTALHLAAKENNSNIIGLLLGSLKSGEFVNTVREMFLVLDYYEDTAWVNAAETNSSRAPKRYGIRLKQ
jgi:ankyrin repeat protein